jgi:G3E family GTPase
MIDFSLFAYVGCLCCNMGAEFFQSVAQLIELSETRGYSYDHIVIEASGVSCALAL